jgi:hypothetical protein
MATKPRRDVEALQDIPNIGPRCAEDLRRMGISKPSQLVGRDGLTLYRKLCRVDGVRHDPCLADTFLAAVDYMNGAPKRPWYWYTARRKKLLK